MFNVFNNNGERERFYNSSLCKHFIKNQVKYLNQSFFNKQSLYYLYDSIVDFLNASIFKNEEDYVNLEFENLNSKKESIGHYAIHETSTTEPWQITLDSRFLKLSDYLNDKKLAKNKFDKLDFNNSIFLIHAIINILHEFTHHIQNKLSDNVTDKDKKKEMFKVFSQSAIYGSSDIYSYKSFPLKKSEQLLEYYLKITNEDIADLIYEIDPMCQDLESPDYQALIENISYANYFYAPCEIHARTFSISASINLLNIWKSSGKLNKEAKDFINYSTKYLNDPINMELFEDTYELSNVNQFFKKISKINNEKLFDFINNEGLAITKGKPNSRLSKKAEEAADTLSYFFKYKDIKTLINFFAQTLEQNPNKFSFLVVQKAIDNNDLFDVKGSLFCKKYYKYLKQNISAIKPEQIATQFLYDEQLNSLLRYFVLNHKWDHVCAILEDEQFMFNDNPEVVKEIKNSQKDILNFYKQKTRANENKKHLLFSITPFYISSIHKI